MTMPCVNCNKQKEQPVPSVIITYDYFKIVDHGGVLICEDFDSGEEYEVIEMCRIHSPFNDDIDDLDIVILSDLLKADVSGELDNMSAYIFYKRKEASQDEPTG
jgi:hypothetical protein